MTADDEPKRRWRPPAGEASGRRALKASVKDKGKKASSRAWIERQLNDPYVARAREEGWRSRAAFKLLELDARFGLLRAGLRVCDLGAAPGGWSQAALRRKAGAVVGIDLLPIEALPGATFLQMDFLAPEAPKALTDALGWAPDLVMSDMAANTTGHRATDQIKTGALADAAAHFAMATLAPGGAFVTKAFQGGLDAQTLAALKRAFASVRHAKPPASRPESPEVYVVAQGFRGRA